MGLKWKKDDDAYDAKCGSINLRVSLRSVTYEYGKVPKFFYSWTVMGGTLKMGLNYRGKKRLDDKLAKKLKTMAENWTRRFAKALLKDLEDRKNGD